MKKLMIGFGVAVLLFGGAVSANALLIDQGDGTILDNNSGLYWQQDVGLWGSMTYDQQITDISTNFGGWHMATMFDMQSLWTNNPQEIFEHFTPTVATPYTNNICGRIDQVNDPGSHYVGIVTHRLGPGPESYYTTALDHSSIGDTSQGHETGAWVVRDSSPVPEPATMLLFGTGLVALAGSRLRKKKK